MNRIAGGAKSRLEFKRNDGYFTYGRIPIKVCYSLLGEADSDIGEKCPGHFIVTPDLNIGGGGGYSLSIWIYKKTPLNFKDAVMYHELVEAEFMFADGLVQSEAHKLAVVKTEEYAKKFFSNQEYILFQEWQKKFAKKISDQ